MPDDVVFLVEGDEHGTGELGFAGELVHGFAGHDGETARREKLVGHAGHAGEDAAAHLRGEDCNGEKRREILR